MGKGQGGNRLVFIREPGEQGDGADQLFPDQAERVVKDHQIGVVSDIAARRAQMDDALGLRTLLAIGVDVGHDVVPDLFFPDSGDIVVDIVRVRPQLVELFVGNGKPQLLFGFG